MRRDLRRHVDPALLPPANELDAPLRAHVREVHVSARAAREQNVANHHDLFGLARNSLEAEPRADDPLVHRAAVRERELLAVIDDGNAEGLRVLERRAHEVRAHDRAPVVAHRNGAGADHLAELRERFAFLSDGDRADRMHARRVDAARLPNDESDRGLIVGDGLRVRHRADRGEAARGRGARARRDRLDVLAAGLAQMAVHVDESRRDVCAACSRGSRRHRDARASRPIASTLPSRSNTSATSSRPCAGSITCPPSSSRSRIGARHQRSPPLAPFAASASSGLPPASR